jgi:hypothetical protein
MPKHVRRPLPPTPPPPKVAFDIRECGHTRLRSGASYADQATVHDIARALHAFKIDLQHVMNRIETRFEDLEEHIQGIETSLAKTK